MPNSHKMIQKSLTKENLVKFVLSPFLAACIATFTSWYMERSISDLASTMGKPMPIEEIHKPFPICDPGFIYNPERNGCIYEEFIAFQLVCPEGCKSGPAGVCSCVEEEDYIYQCPTGYKVTESESSLGEDEKEEEGMSIAADYQLKVPKKCIKVLEKPAYVRCPTGALLKDKTCVSSLIVPAERSCKDAGTESGGTCVVVEERKADQSCNPPYEKRERVIVWEPVNTTQQAEMSSAKFANMANLQAAKRKSLVEPDEMGINTIDSLSQNLSHARWQQASADDFPYLRQQDHILYPDTDNLGMQGDFIANVYDSMKGKSSLLTKRIGLLKKTGGLTNNSRNLFEGSAPSVPGNDSWPTREQPLQMPNLETASGEQRLALVAKYSLEKALHERKLGILSKLGAGGLTVSEAPDLPDLSVWGLLGKNLKNTAEASTSSAAIGHYQNSLLSSSSANASLINDKEGVRTIVTECYSSATFPAKSVCPVSHVLDGSICKREMVERVEMECEDKNYTLDELSHSCVHEISTSPLQHCTDEGYYLEANNKCVRSEKVDPVYRCREGFEFLPEENVCVKLLKEPPKLTCNDSSAVFDGTTCIRREEKQASIECQEGSIVNDICVQRHVVPSKPSCPEGYLFDSMLFRCTTVNVAPVSYVCPEGTEKIGEAECEQQKVQAVEESCPEWFTMVNGVCKREKVAEREWLCDEGYALIGTDCIAQVEADAKYECDAEFTLEDEMCVASEVMMASIKCAQGYEEKDDKCIRKVNRPGTASCPDGYFYRKGKCVTSQVARPKRGCPPGMALNKAETECYTLIQGDNVTALGYGVDDGVRGMPWLPYYSGGLSLDPSENYPLPLQMDHEENGFSYNSYSGDRRLRAGMKKT